MPAVVEELEEETQELRGFVEDVIARFPAETWKLGLDLLTVLHGKGVDARILTLINDWYFLRQLPKGHASKLRKEFYGLHETLFPTFAQPLKEAGLNEHAILQLGPHPIWVSEYWLRRRAERRLKRLKNPSLRWDVRNDGVKELVFDELGRECRRLLCGGRADCAEEVLELLCLLHEAGYRNLINFIPRECERPVNKGCMETIDLFAFADLRILNIGLPCIGGGFRGESVGQDAKIYTVTGERLEDGTVQADLRSHSGDSWIMS